MSISDDCGRGCHLLRANAYKLHEYLGQDLYGLDLCVEFVDPLTHHSDTRVTFVFVISCNAMGADRSEFSLMTLHTQREENHAGFGDHACL